MLSDKFGNIKQRAINKIKYFILEDHSATPHYIIFNFFIYSVTLLNFIYLCMLSYPISQDIVTSIIIINIFCSSVFVVEIIFKLLVLGIRPYFKDKLNIMDFCVVWIGVIEIIVVQVSDNVADNGNSALSSFRAIRFIRLLKLFKKETFMGRFVNFIIVSLRDLIYYTLLLLFFLFLFALAGRELFANRIYVYNKTDEWGYVYPDVFLSPRENFDNLFNAFVTVFILFIGDSWPSIMYEFMKVRYLASVAYFLVIIIIGNIMIFNLFLSIMMSNYDPENAIVIFEIDAKTKNLKRKLRRLTSQIRFCWRKLKVNFYKVIDCCQTSKKKEISKSSTISGLTSSPSRTTFNEKHPIIRKSLGCLPPTSKIREEIAEFISTNKYYYFILQISIVISLLILGLDTQFTTDMVAIKTNYFLDLITTVIFIVEIVLASIAYGFLFNGPYSYMRQIYNILDFITVCLSITYLYASTSKVFELNYMKVNTLNVMRFIKMFRLVRVFKVVGFSKSLQASLHTFTKSVNEMLKIIIIGSIFVLIFAVIGMTYFRGLYSRCVFTNMPSQFIYSIVTKWDCMDYGGDWISPYPNFDNIRSSFILLFEMMTTENWTYYMYNAIDATYIDYQPVKNNRFHWSLFFIAYMIIAYFFLLNLSIAILCDNFKKEKAAIENTQFQKPLQIEFFKIYKSLYKIPIPRKQEKLDKVTKALLNILESIYFDVFITVCIISNMITLTINIPGMDAKTTGLISNMGTVFSWIFITECVLKIYVFRFSYFSIGWNILDFIVALETIFNLLTKSIEALQHTGFDSSLLRTLRVARVLRILKKAESLNRIFNLFLNSIPGVMNIAILYFLLLYIYSSIGTSLFGLIKFQTYIGEKWNFQGIGNSLLLLIRITSGESWNYIMHECMNTRKSGYYCKYYDEMTPEEIASK
jgi:hypothetical protein